MTSRPVRVLRLTGLAVAAGLALTACSVGSEASAPSPTATGAPVNPNPAADAVAEVTRAHVDAAIEDLPASVESAMTETGTPGIAVGVVYDGEVLFVDGFGVRDLESGDAVDADTVFALASVSKSLSASVIARAMDEGIVTWDTPIAEHLEGFTLSDAYAGAHVTIGDMFAHRSGLYEHAGDELEELGYGRDDVIERLRVIPLEPFRAVYHYGNFDITAAGEAAARAAGEDWADLAERLVLSPLGMDSTSFRYADLEARDDRALGHMMIDGDWVVSPQQRQPDAQAPAGGASSSVADMTIWLQMLLASGEHDGEPFVSAESLLPAMSPQMPTGLPDALGSRAGMYGYGFNVSTTAGGLVDVSHSGAFALGAGTVVKMLPREGLGIVVLSNGAANGVPEAIAARFTDIAQYGQRRADWFTIYTDALAGLTAPTGELVGAEAPRDPAAPAELSNYEGVYANDYFGPATITADDEGLVLSLGPAGRWPLEHWDGDVFVFRLDGENATPGSISQATFRGDALVLEYFDKHGLGTFTR